MVIRHRSQLALTTLFILVAGLASDALTCPMMLPDKTQTISVVMSSGLSTEVIVEYFKGNPDLDRSGACMASARIPLSRFPSSRVATRPGELAAALREIADEWGAKECTIWISYENDTKDHFANHELCVMGSFKFDKGDYWSSTSEGYCWEPTQES